MTHRGWLAAALIFAAAACGHAADLPKEISTPLNQQVDQIEQLASNGDFSGAHQHAAEFRSLVLELRDGGRLDQASSERMLAAVSAVETALDASAPPDASTASNTATPTPPSTTRVAAATTAVVSTTTKKPKPGKDKHDD